MKLSKHYVSINANSIGDSFLPYNNSIESLNLPAVERIGDEFLCYKESLKTINLPTVKHIGNNATLEKVTTKSW